MPCVLAFLRKGRYTILQMNAWMRHDERRKSHVEDESKKEEWNDETMCVEYLADSVGKPADLINAEDNVVVMGEVAIFLLP